MLAFLVVLVILLIIYTYTTKGAEGFSSTYSCPPSHTVKIPENATPKPVDSLPATNPVVASSLPGELMGAPYQQIARTSPLPYQDPSLVKTTRQRILDTLESVKGFLAFEAQEIEDRSDPSIQLPLQNTRADFARLQDEANLLQRNPGIQPDMTDLQINEIEANLAYLQRQVRLIGVNKKFGDDKWEGFVNPSSGATGTMGADMDKSESGNPATEAELVGFTMRIQGEIMRLSASGTNDPIVQARITNLTQMKQQVDTIIEKLQSGALLSTEVPITAGDIQKALPVLGNLNEPLPQMLKALQLPAGLANMLPSNVANNPETARQINSLIDKYASDFIQGASASVTVNVNYASERQADIARARGQQGQQARGQDNGDLKKKTATSSIDRTGFPSQYDLDQVASSSTVDSKDDDTIRPFHSNDPRYEGRNEPAQFNWKERALAIQEQVRQRGLNANDFGILPKNAKVSNDFSWKGYAQMVCTRLGATMDPGLPETCGCPPMDWKGWN